MATSAKKRSTTKTKTSAARKRSTKSVAKKASVKKTAAVASGKGGKINASQLRKFNIFAAASSTVLAVLSVVLMSKETVVASLPYAAKDAFASTGSTVFGPAYKTVCELEIRYILALIFGLSAIFSLLLATRFRKSYESQVANSVSVLRWIFSAISLGLILELTTKIAEIDSVITLKTTAALVLVTGILWIISEQQTKAGKGNRGIASLSLFTLFLAAMPLIVSLIASAIYGMERFGWHVYALAATTGIGLLMLAITQYKASKNGTSGDAYMQLEGKYLSIDYLIKLSAFVILLIAFFK